MEITYTSSTPLKSAADLLVIPVYVYRNRELHDLVIFGEVGLSGEIRPVPSGQERLAEAAKHGFRRAIIPRGNAPREAIAGMEVRAVHRLEEALAALD